MSKCNFIGRLTEEQLKELTYLCLNECDKNENTHYLDGKELGDVVINDLQQNEDLIRYSSISYDHRPFSMYAYNENIYNSNFCLNDFEMYMSDGKWQVDLSQVLHIYLASIFNDEYLKYLMNKRINDAINEKLNIQDSINDYLMILKNSKKEKVKNKEINKK